MASFAARTGSAAAALVAFFALSCGPSPQDRAAGARESRSAVISDQVHNGGVPGFFWLPPMAPATAYGEFKAGLAPAVTVERLPLDPARPPVASFTAAEVRTDGVSHYMAVWDTRASSLDPTFTYRIRVVLGWFELGFADVDVVSSGSELRNVQTSEYIPLLDGRTLPIKFRIDVAAMKCPERPDGPCRAQDQCHVAGTCDPSTGACSNPPKPDDTSCNDGNACTQTDACRAGVCTGANPVVCELPDQCHEAGACDPSTGVCSNPSKADGAACDDGSFCTQADTCQAGVCNGADPVVCEALDQCHAAGTCDPDTGSCSNPAADNGTTCNDQKACTTGDTCQDGACAGSPVLCTASDQCHLAGTCDPSSGTCSNPAKEEGASCSDGNLCTQSDACLAGTCTGTNPILCTKLDECHDAGTCDPTTGACSNPTNTAACDDGNACTRADRCRDGACTGSDPVVCAALDECHDPGTCDPGTGVCSMSTAKSDGTPCSDGDACTQTDTCEKGVCTGANPVVCAAPGPCWDPGTCDSATGTCSVAIARRDGTPCNDDADFCNRQWCESGACLTAVPREELDCSDTDPCTRDGCDQETAGLDGVTGCVHIPDHSAKAPPECRPETPPAAVSIVGFTLPGEVQGSALTFHAGERLRVAIGLRAAGARASYPVEFVLTTALPPPNEDPVAIPVGTRQVSDLTEGDNESWIELAIPDTLPAGDYHIAVHEYPVSPDRPAGAPDGLDADVFFPNGDDQPLRMIHIVGPENPVLDLLDLEVAQAALLIDEASTVGGDRTIRVETPYSARLDLVSHNLGATGVPVTAEVKWNGQTFPLWMWDPDAPSAPGLPPGRWVDTLFLDPLEAEAPTSVFLELALSEDDASQIRPGDGIEPVEAPVTVTVTVNKDRIVPEATCVPIEDPLAPVNCRHSAERPGLVYPAPPAPTDDEPMLAAGRAAAPAGVMMTLGESGNTAPLRYQKTWSKNIGNEWAGAGIKFEGSAELSKGGFDARVYGGVPMSVLKIPFDFASAEVTADALVATRTAHVRVSVTMLGTTVYDWPKNQALEVNLEKTFAKVEREKSESKTVIVYIVPVTFELGASGTFGLVGNLSASYMPGSGALPDTASLMVSGGPYVNVDAYGSATLGTSFFGAGARVTLSLIDAVLKGEVAGALVLTKTSYGWPFQITGGLSERLYYDTSFLDGRVGLIVTYPVLKWCKKWIFYYPCGFKTATKEAVLCSWNGFSFGDDLLNLKQQLFVIDMPACPRQPCGVGQCGPFYDGCEVVNCGGCVEPLSCGGGGTPNVCGCTPSPTCDGLCGQIQTSCGLKDCGGCPAPNTCGGGGTPNVCGCTPAACEGRCGVIDDGCGSSLACGGCPAPNTCGGGGTPNVCGCTPRTCEGRCGVIDDGCGGSLACGSCGGVAPYMVGTYTTATKWGGWYGTWNSDADLEITPAGEVFRGGTRIANPTFVNATPQNHPWTTSCASCHGDGYPKPSVSWYASDGNGSNAQVTFKEGSTDTYFWPGGSESGWLFEGWLQSGSGGATDYRGLRNQPCSNPGDYYDTCGTCIHRNAEPPVLLYSDPVDRYMRDPTHVSPEDPNCADFDLPTSILVEEAAYAIQGIYEGYSSSAWVYFPDANGAYLEPRYIETYPSGTGIVEGTKVFDPPIPVRRVHICSWWNPAYLRRLDLFGDPGACAP